MGEKANSVIAIYPGSFDPFTNGHLDLIQRTTHLFDKLVVSVLQNEKKKSLFSVEERLEMIRESLPEHGNIEIDSFDGLLVDYAASKNARVILRGIRAISDYEYELQMALMNRRLSPKSRPSSSWPARPIHSSARARSKRWRRSAETSPDWFPPS